MCAAEGDLMFSAFLLLFRFRNSCRTSWSNSFMPGTGIFCSYAWNSCSNTCGGGGAGVLGRTSTSVLRQSRLHFEPRPRVHLH